MPCEKVYPTWYSKPSPKRLRRWAWNALYFWLPSDAVPETCVICASSAGLPARYGPGTTLPLTIIFCRYGSGTIRCVPCWPTYHSVSTARDGNWYSLAKLHCIELAGLTNGSHKRNVAPLKGSFGLRPLNPSERRTGGSQTSGVL